MSAYHADASAAAVVDGRLAAAAEEERFCRIKHVGGFPAEALRYVMRAVNARPGELLHLAVARNPWSRLWQKLLYAVKVPRTARGRLTVQSHFANIGTETAAAIGGAAKDIRVHRIEHHKAHLASSFFVSPFEEAALLSIDGLGDFASTMWGVGRGNRIEPMGAIAFPNSLGIFYMALTQFLGFPKYGDEYKVMGLASYGKPAFIDSLREILIAQNGDGMGFRLNPRFFSHTTQGMRMTWEGEPKIANLYSEGLNRILGPARRPDEPIDERHHDIASSTQRRLEEVVLDRLRALRRETGLRKLCIAGGVAYNCVTNGKILEQTGFDDVYIQSAAGDAGLAVGAAMYVWHQELGRPRDFVMEHSYWGPEFDEMALRTALDSQSAQLEHQRCEVRKIENEAELCRMTAQRIAAGEVVGWFQGRMEWGPRALGNRSILADPRRPEMREILNLKIKRRESFRPFAPSILEDAAGEYFTQSYPSPFMLMAYQVKPDKRDKIPATTHVDGTGRLQTVNRSQNRLYYELISEFRRQTGVPVLLNTSFNENEPVVCKPEEALDCFLRTKMDVLVMGPFFVSRIVDSQ